MSRTCRCKFHLHDKLYQVATACKVQLQTRWSIVVAVIMLSYFIVFA